MVWYFCNGYDMEKKRKQYTRNNPVPALSGHPSERRDFMGWLFQAEASVKSYLALMTL